MEISITPKGNCLIALSESDPTKKYYITPHHNPLWKWVDNSLRKVNDNHHEWPHQILWTCTCPDFMMGKARYGENPFANPCKHVRYVLEHAKDLVLKVQENLNAP